MTHCYIQKTQMVWHSATSNDPNPTTLLHSRRLES